MPTPYIFPGTPRNPAQRPHMNPEPELEQLAGLADAYPRLTLRAHSSPWPTPCGLCGAEVLPTGLDWALEAAPAELACESCADKYAPAVLHERRGVLVQRALRRAHG